MTMRTGGLATARRLIAWQFTSTATVYRKTEVADTTGGYIDTYAVVASYPCSFSSYQITPLERETTFTVQSIVYWRFLFPAGSDIRTTDRLKVGDRGFEVVNAGSDMLEIQLTVLAQEIT